MRGIFVKNYFCYFTVLQLVRLLGKISHNFTPTSLLYSFLLHFPNQPSSIQFSNPKIVSLNSGLAHRPFILIAMTQATFELPNYRALQTATFNS